MSSSRSFFIMSVKEYYLQCELEKDNYLDIAWIPQKFAVEGRYIGIKLGDTWDEGWLVKTVYATTISKDQMLEARDGYKHHRKNTDV